MERKQAGDFDQDLLDLFDQYVAFERRPTSRPVSVAVARSGPKHTPVCEDRTAATA